MEKLLWIQDLVRNESLIENEGFVESVGDLTQEELLLQESVIFLIGLKNEFQDVMTAFNELKGDVPGLVKIYGIAKTHSDFMLFRHGYKLVVGLKSPGTISIRMNFVPTSYVPATLDTPENFRERLVGEEYTIEARLGAFGEVHWVYKNIPVSMTHLVKYFFTLFTRESNR
ncbi:MAG: hypothetical protein ACK5V3_06805 [Bdellovibrionales bacterium]